MSDLPGHDSPHYEDMGAVLAALADATGDGEAQ